MLSGRRVKTASTATSLHSNSALKISSQLISTEQDNMYNVAGSTNHFD